jgi:long-subunit acyl-CoA synthetase (AMP-forming)
MATPVVPDAIDVALGASSLSTAFLGRAAAAPNQIALREFGSDRSLRLGQWASRSRAIAGGLVRLGVGPGDRVALLLSTCMEFHLVDMGALLLGAVPFSMYVTSPVVQLAEIAANAAPRVIVTEAALADKARELAAGCPAIEHVVVLGDRAGGPSEYSLAELELLCPESFDAAAHGALATREDICTLVYTSGTTGPPKGVQFRHGAILHCLASIRQRFPTSAGDRALCYLPMAHVAERIYGHYAAFVYGYKVTSLADLGRMSEALCAVRPTRYFGTPRFYEKVLSGLHRFLGESPDGKRLQEAWDARCARVRAEQTGRPLPPGDDAADRETVRVLAEITGLDQTRFAVVAGAPSTLEVLEQIAALGIPINEFYGSSEVIIVTAGPPERVKLGTAGTALAGAQLRLAEDGEILVSGPTVTPGYFRDPDRTAEVLDAEGWFHTGDIGELDPDGYLRIVDRKKALIINSAGKNMSPANIEQAIKTGEPLLAQVYAFGDRRSYNVALIVLDRDGLVALAATLGIDDPGFAELSRRQEILHAVDAAVARGNARLSRVEQIKRFVVLDHDWPLGGEELTPTAKLKRREIAAKYAVEIDGLYA